MFKSHNAGSHVLFASYLVALVVAIQTQTAAAQDDQQEQPQPEVVVAVIPEPEKEQGIGLSGDPLKYEQALTAKLDFLLAQGELESDVADQLYDQSMAQIEASSGSNRLPAYDPGTGIEDFEGAFPGLYWFVGDDDSGSGLDYWDDVSCISYEGGWSAWCADIGDQTNCVQYDDDMDAFMYVEATYLGTTTSGDNRLRFELWSRVEDCCDWFRVEFEGFRTCPPHAGGTPDATYKSPQIADTGAVFPWDTQNIALPSSFNPCLYIRVKFVFHSDFSVVNGEGAFVDYIQFNNRSDTEIYPINGGFNCPDDADLYDDGEPWRSFTPQSVTAGQAGQPFEIHCDVRNGGDAPSGSFVVKFYASTNTTISTSDHYIGQKSMSSIPGGDYDDCDWSGTFPTNIPAGIYNVGWIIDANHQVSESDENNNTAYKEGYQLNVLGLPDLYDDGEPWRSFTPQSVTAGQAGQPFEIHCDVRNGGDAPSGSFVVKFYASTNTTISTSDHYIGQESMSSILDGDYDDCDWSGTINIPAGTYYVGWIIDANYQVSECNESNNKAYKEGYQLSVLPPTYTLNLSKVGNGRARVNGTLRTLPWSGTFTAGTTVSLEGVPDSTWDFSHWSGDLSGTANPTTITINGNTSVTVHFTQVPYTLSLSKSGNGRARVNGTLHTLPWSGTFTAGETVSLEGVPDGGWNFSHWSDDLSGSTNPTTITMNANRSVTVHFTQDHTLCVYKTGNGRARINGTLHTLPWCGTLAPGSMVSLEAVPDSDWDFSHWSGDLSGTANPTTITINGNTSVTVHFTQVPYTLSLSKSGNGRARVNGTLHTLPWSGTFTAGETVSLEGVPDGGWNFSHWSDDLSGSTNPTTITMNANRSVTVHFTQDHTLCVYKTGNGRARINGTLHTLPWCGTLAPGSMVSLEAVPDSDWDFSHWSGDLSGTANPTTITINGNTSVTVHFTSNIPDPPDGVRAQGDEGCGDVVLSWNLSSNATGYKIYYDEDSFNPPFSPGQNGNPNSGSDVGNVTRVSISDLTPGQTYYFAVKAYNTAGESNYSAQDATTSGSDCPPPPPRTVHLTVHVDGPGTTSHQPSGWDFALDEVVTLSAEPEERCDSFSRWEGVPADRETDNPVEIVMDTDKTITAHFEDGTWVPGPCGIGGSCVLAMGMCFIGLLVIKVLPVATRRVR